MHQNLFWTYAQFQKQHTGKVELELKTDKQTKKLHKYRSTMTNNIQYLYKKACGK